MTQDAKYQRRLDRRGPFGPGRPRGPIIAIFAAGAVLLLAGIVLIYRSGRIHGADRRPATASSWIVRPVHPAPLPPEIEPIPVGTTLSDLLAKHGFSAAEAYTFWREVRPVFDMQKVLAGRELRFLRDASGAVQAVEYDVDDRHYLHVERVGRRFLPGIESYRFETRPAFIAGVIEDIPIAAVERQGEKPILAMTMCDLLAWDIDFYTELRIGDTFRLIFEKNYREVRFVGYGEILAVEFVCQGRKYEAFRFVYPDTGQADHFDAAGNSVRKEFLRSPLPFARITSRFSLSRFHPIRKVFTAHYGVDYGAPVGTPVQATADGLVIAAGWNGGAGQMIRIRHAHSYETMYLHLSRIFVNVGNRVKMGQDIGLVGSTGESTGPHLDYRILQGSAFINPLGRRFEPVAPLRPEYRSAFEKEMKEYRARLAAGTAGPRR